MAIDITKTSGTYSLVTGTSELTVVTLTNTENIIVTGIWLDLVNLTQSCTVRVYFKIDGTNFREFSTTSWSTVMADGLLINGDMPIDSDLRVTIQSGVAEGVTRSIPYKIFYNTSETSSTLYSPAITQPEVWDQETATATTANGTTWVDLLDKSSITSNVKLLAIKVTKGGVWVGDLQLRITNGSGTKIWPPEDYSTEGSDFTSGNLAVFTFELEISSTTGYKVQFRSSSAADVAGKTVVLDNLDVSTIQNSTLGQGATLWTYTLTNSVTGLPIGNAEIKICSDAGGTNIIAQGITNSLGIVQAYLNSGDYYIFRTCPGYSFSDPDIEVVT
jgi:hypothetical protein